jgi:hemolysin activation/secretion protein
MNSIHIKRRFGHRAATFAIFSSISLGAYAQIAQALRPDAGSLLKQFEQETAMPWLTTPERISEQATPSEPLESGGPVVWVSGFRFKGNTHLSDAELENVLSHFTNRSLNFAQLQQAANALILAYRRAGWLANSWLPKQVINQGMVELVIQESALGDVHVMSQGVASIDMQQLEAIAHAALQSHPDWPSLDRVDEVVTRLQDLPGTAVTASLQEGKQPDTSDLMLLVNSETRMQLVASLDNQGNTATGIQRQSIQTQFNNPMRMGDSAIMQLSLSDGSTYIRGNYSLPVGSRGLRLSTSLSHFSYTLIGSFAALNIQGQANTHSLELSAPLSLIPRVQMRWAWGYDHRAYANQDNVLGTPSTISRYALGVHKLSFNAAWPTQSWGNAYHSLQASLSEGNVDLNGSPNRDADAQTANTQGQFRKLNLLWSRQQQWRGGWGLHMQAEMQRANKNLDSSEKIMLGGNSGVRAYPTGEAAGSQGWMGKLELQKQWSEQWISAAFYDHGQILVFRQNLAASGDALTNPNSYALSGYGLSLHHKINKHIDVLGTWSRRIGQNPAANAISGNDVDGHRQRDRLWLSLSFRG